MRLINPIIPGESRYPTITPFTIPDGHTYLKTLEHLVEVMKTLVDSVNENNEEMQVFVVDLINSKIDEINTAFEQQQQDVEDQLEQQNTNITTQLSNQNDAIATLISETEILVNDAVQQVINNSIEVQDPVVSALLDDDNSETAVSSKHLMTRYLASQDVVNVSDLITDDWGVDVSSEIQSIIDDNEGKTLYFSGRDYVLSRQGSYTAQFNGQTRYYALLIDGHSNTKLVFAPSARLLIPTANTVYTNGIFIDNSDTVVVDGARGYGADSEWTRLFYSRAVVAIQRSTRVTVSNAYAQDLEHCVFATNSSHITIVDCDADMGGLDTTGAAYGLYSTTDSNIRSCTTYGGSGDGDISLYGSGRNNEVVSCKAYGYVRGDTNKTPTSTILQGICVDANQHHSRVYDNYVEGYFYGIDVKSTVSGTHVRGNTVMRCHVGIAIRNGELNQSTSVNIIENNTIMPNGGNGSSSVVAHGETCDYGILVSGSAYGAIVRGNTVTVQPATSSTQYEWIAVAVSVSASAPSTLRQKPITISDNYFNNYIEFGATVTRNDRSRVIHATGSLNLTIENNSFSQSSASTPESVIKTTDVVTISGNTVDRGSSAPLIEHDGGRVSITGNTFRSIPGGAVSCANSRQVQIVGNNFGYSENPAAVIVIDSCTGLLVSGNTATAYSGQNNGKLVNAIDSTQGVIQGNTGSGNLWLGEAAFANIDSTVVQVNNHVYQM